MSVSPRIALVHDFLVDLRGAERVFAVMCDIWPDADVFTAIYDEEGTEGAFAHRRVHTSRLQALRPTARSFRALLPLYPRAMEALDLSAYDVVVSSSSAWAHGVRPAPGAVHVCYCHNTFRYAWNERDATLAARNPLVRPALAHTLRRWRSWDRRAAERVTRYIANSDVTAERISANFGRESAVLYPPVEVDRFAPGPVGDHYLAVGELLSHKRADVVVRAFARMGRRLVVVGDGPERRALERLAGPTVEFRGRVSDDEVAELMRGCQALVLCAEEEFGIAPVEVMASGRPVIALGSGGVLETVTDGVTGRFFSHANVEELVAAVEGFDTRSIDPGACVAAAARFAPERFQEELEEAVGETLAEPALSLV